MKTALVLSAGGMFGAYQAGVWQALEPVFHPDVVIGCSIGSVNGWAIASGIPPGELIRTWLDPRCAALMAPRNPWRPWRAIFDPAPLSEMIREMASTYQPRVPFGVAVTRLPQLRIQIVSTPDLQWRHVLASCAVPFGYPPVRVDGQYYCDGGLLSVMPLWAAREFGVDRAIAVNVLPSMPLNAMRAAVRMVRLLAPNEPKVTGVDVLRLGPPRVLGTFQHAITWEPRRIAAWIERGRTDTEALIQAPEFTNFQAGTERFV